MLPPSELPEQARELPQPAFRLAWAWGPSRGLCCPAPFCRAPSGPVRQVPQELGWAQGPEWLPRVQLVLPEQAPGREPRPQGLLVPPA